RPAEAQGNHDSSSLLFRRDLPRLGRFDVCVPGSTVGKEAPAALRRASAVSRLAPGCEYSWAYSSCVPPFLHPSSILRNPSFSSRSRIFSQRSSPSRIRSRRARKRRVLDRCGPLHTRSAREEKAEIKKSSPCALKISLKH